nr:hypothetical protein BaRGS_022806 [Batillaria attramentaria]
MVLTSADIHRIIDVFTQNMDMANSSDPSDLPVEVVVVMSDTTSTLMAGNYVDKRARIGLILGTGCNAAFVENLENIERWTGDTNDPKHIRVTAVAMSIELALRQKFEKSVGGLYLGELVRMTLVQLAKEGIAALVKRMRLPEVTVAIDGSVYERHPKFHGYMMEILDKDEFRFNTKIASILSELVLTSDGVERIMEIFTHQMDLANSADETKRKQSDLLMENTHVRTLMDGTENGEYLGLDLGGTNFRVILIKLTNGVAETTMDNYTIPADVLCGPVKGVIVNTEWGAAGDNGCLDFYRTQYEKDVDRRSNHVADGSTGFPAAAGRYHLYVCLACPWAHRTLIVRKLKGLEDVISTTVVDWLLGEGGWNFTDSKPKCSLDTVNNCKFLKEVYLKADPDYSGNITVPCLWDKEKKTVVNNESSEIIRMFNTEFNAFCKTDEQRKLHLYPESLRPQIDAVNEWIYPQINNGVYRSGFAHSQEAYSTAVNGVFDGLDKVEAILSKQRYLVGNQLTEADIRLFTTLVRFDTVYHTHFKTNKRRIVDYPNMWAYTRDIYQIPATEPPAR